MILFLTHQISEILPKFRILKVDGNPDDYYVLYERP